MDIEARGSNCGKIGPACRQQLPEGAVLAEPWSKATIVLLDAALAFGAPDLMSSADQESLTSSQRRLDQA
jgi:hypothetical protein